MPRTLSTEDLLAQVPGARAIDGFEIPDDPDAAHPTPFGDNPPADWFLTPHPDVQPGATGIITAEGQFCAYSHEWDRCHNGYTGAGECWTPPRSVTGNRYFQQSSVVTAEGIQLPVGVIPLGEGHAPVDVDVATAMAHYGHPERVTVRARVVETETGAIMCGAIVPGTTHRQVATMRAAALSGDWRWVPELQAQDFLGPCFVARPGLPLGLEQAAIDQAFWDIARQLLTSDDTATTASGLVVPRSVLTIPTTWTPRAPLTDRLSLTVIAAATGGTMPTAPATITVPVPDGVAPDVFEKAVAAVTATGGQPTAVTADGAGCGCGTSTATAPAPIIRQRTDSRLSPMTAAAGTALSYRELDDEVSEAVRNAFNGGSGERWVWIRDWDDTWAVFELEVDDPINGFSNDTFMVGITIGSGPGDDLVQVDVGSVTEVIEIFAPAPGAVPTGILASATGAVTADPSDTAAIAELTGMVKEIGDQLAALASDVAGLQAQELPMADAVAELPEAPEQS